MNMMNPTSDRSRRELMTAAMVLAASGAIASGASEKTSAAARSAGESPEPLYRPRDTHWNVRGNRVAAAAEAAFLRQELCQTH